MGFRWRISLELLAKKIMHQPETSGRFDGSFLCAETDTFYQRSRKFQPFMDYWDGVTQKNSPS